MTDISIFLSTLSLALVLVAFLTGGIPIRLTLAPVEARVTVQAYRNRKTAEIKTMRIYERDLARFTVEYAMKRGYSISRVVYDTDKGMITVMLEKSEKRR